MSAIKISKSTARRLMKKLGFTYITPPPVHYKQDQNKQEEFKKSQ
ncbi:MAG: helix-turn-helix domain-containing protein [Wolbachia sp.]